ncbi:MAG: hypothetical protein IPK44_08015 [Candidatus Accumulibacter sp.]|nr:hypothetical protein [Accumulibacter sp.]
MGLGLTISRRLLGLMGGRVWVDSELDRGSTFHAVIGFASHQTGRVPRLKPAWQTGSDRR